MSENAFTTTEANTVQYELSCTYLAHHELESVNISIITTVVIIIIITFMIMIIVVVVNITCSKSAGTEDGWTRSLIMPGAPLMKSNAEPGRASSAMTTTPDLRVWELNSRVLVMVSLAVWEVET